MHRSNKLRNMDLTAGVDTERRLGTSRVLASYSLCSLLQRNDVQTCDGHISKYSKEIMT